MSAALICVYIGGGLHAAWALFHLLAPRMLNWKNTREQWDSGNASFYQMLNVCLIFFMAGGAYFSLVYAHELLAPGLGHKLLAYFAAFWLLRLGIQNRLFKVFTPISMLMNLGYLLTAVVYIIALMRGN